MDCIQIQEVKKFMSALLAKPDFDQFLLQEAEIVTANTYRIDGRVQKKFYSSREYEELGSPIFRKWGDLRPLCFEIIKGHKTPIRFKFLLRLGDRETEKLLEKTGLSMQLSDIGGLYLNLVYENDMLNCITSTSLNLFSMDKSLEKAWDEEIQKLLALI